MNDTKMKTNSNDELRLKRTQTMIGVWDYLVKNNQIDGEKFHLSKPLVNEIIEQYITDVDFLKKRYQIVAKIQLHKIAGLMASLIVKYRPVISLMDEYTTENELYVNELLAIIHGLSVCGEFNTNEENASIVTEAWFEPWFRDFSYLLHYRHHTPEGLIFIFETLCFFKFPKNLEIATD